MMVRAINEYDIYGVTMEGFSRCETAKPTTDNDDPWFLYNLHWLSSVIIFDQNRRDGQLLPMFE